MKVIAVIETNERRVVIQESNDENAVEVDSIEIDAGPCKATINLPRGVYEKVPTGARPFIHDMELREKSDGHEPDHG